MCGGEGSRLRAGGIDTEKPLVEVDGRPMLDRICSALAGSRIETVYAAVSPAAPATRERARDLAPRSCTVIETPGDGYVDDLDHALDDVGAPVLTVAADLPLLAPSLVDRVLSVAGRAGDSVGDAGVPSLAVCVPAALKRRLGASVDATIPPGAVDDTELLSDPSASSTPELAPTGVNVAADSGNATWVSYDARLAVNVNRPADLDLAETLCRRSLP